MNRAVLKATTPLGLFAFPALFFTLFYGREILALAYGSAYTAAAPALVILFASEFLTTCGIPLVAVYMAMGRPALLRRFSMIRAALMIILLYPCIKFLGLIGAAVAPLISVLVSYGFQLERLRSLTGLDIGKYASSFGRGLVSSLPVMLLWTFLLLFLHSESPGLTIATAIAASAVLYLSGFLLFRESEALRAFLWPFQKRA